jgi:hypothetical protein
MLSKNLTFYKQRVDELNDVLRSAVQVTGPHVSYTSFLNADGDSNLLSGMKNRYVSSSSALKACDVVRFSEFFGAFLKQRGTV